MIHASIGNGWEVTEISVKFTIVSFKTHAAFNTRSRLTCESSSSVSCAAFCFDSRAETSSLRVSLKVTFSIFCFRSAVRCTFAAKRTRLCHQGKIIDTKRDERLTDETDVSIDFINGAYLGKIL